MTIPYNAFQKSIKIYILNELVKVNSSDDKSKVYKVSGSDHTIHSEDV